MTRAGFEELIVETLDGLVIPDVVTLTDPETLFVGQVTDPAQDNYAVVVFRGGTATITEQIKSGRVRYDGSFRFGVFLHAKRRGALMTMLDTVEDALLTLAPATCTSGPETLDPSGGRVGLCEVEFDQ